MAISLSPETQRLSEEQMRETGVNSTDKLVAVALQTLHQTRDTDFEELDPATRAAIEDGVAQAERSERLPWEDVRESLRARFIDRK